ncbi:MAG: UDP-N-acetylglucosamine 1-carboxyvinyltransferase [Ruminococcaceae bacterium]|nr:UDP-N-acetylglucosamine 1-carboxyvinyltransferase [Oscillospiraceae bacterium]
MDKFVIQGGKRLEGTVRIAGSKNSSVAILPATILAKGKFRIENVPDIDDILVIIDILKHLGAKVEITTNSLGEKVFEIDTTDVEPKDIPYALSSKLRASYYFIGSLLGRFRSARVAMPGGCSFGSVRPIDMHLKAFEDLGATTKTLGNIEIELKKPSVVATLNAILAAIRSSGTTIIKNASTDDIIKDVISDLKNRNANIEGGGTDTITVAGCKLDTTLLETNTDIRFDEHSETATLNFILMALNSNCTTVIHHASKDAGFVTLADSLNKMGANIKGAGTDTLTIGPAKATNSSYGIVEAVADELIGTTINFNKVSVGATMNAIMAAVLAKGKTVIKNAAREPHIVDLANFLNHMGANIRGAGSSSPIEITGVEELHGCEWTIIPDQIEAGTYMVAAAITKGHITLTNIEPKHLSSITSKLRECGCVINEQYDSVEVIAGSRLNAVGLTTAPHPGFPTDMQPQFTTLLSVCEGSCGVNDGIWEDRFRYVKQLKKMGADIEVAQNNKSALVKGVPTLNGTLVKADDLRAGAAMIIAGLGAQGETVIENISHIDRGYEDVVEKLTSLGAVIERRSFPDIVCDSCG